MLGGAFVESTAKSITFKIRNKDDFWVDINFDSCSGKEIRPEVFENMMGKPIVAKCIDGDKIIYIVGDQKHYNSYLNRKATALSFTRGKDVLNEFKANIPTRVVEYCVSYDGKYNNWCLKHSDKIVPCTRCRYTVVAESE